MSSLHRTTVFKGAVLSVGMRWTDRLMGLVSTLILARLLTPTDFGLVAMAMIVVGLVDVLLDLGVSSALIQNKDADEQDFSTAWTMRLCQATVAAAIVAVAAPFAAHYYEDHRVTDLMRLIAVTVFIGGLENIGIVKFQKEMEFGRDFKFFFIKRTLATVTTISLAILLRSYWALVIGSLVGRAIGVLLSYGMHSFRPRFSFARAGRLWSFSQWNLVMSVAGYLGSRLDKLIIGRRADSEVLGAYSVADELASMPSSELLAPLGRVMFPAFVSARGDPLEFRRIVLLAFGVQALLGIPMGLGVTLVAAEAVPVALGDQWYQAVPFVQLLGLAAIAASLAHTGHYMLLALGRVKALALLWVSQLVLFVALLVVAFPNAGAYEIAAMRVGVGFAVIVSMYALARWVLPVLRVRDLIRFLWRPSIGAAMMTGAVSVLAVSLKDVPLGIVLIAKIGLGAATYACVVLSLWLLSGRPDGPEEYALGKLRALRWPQIHAA